jgi:hypothetical protein
MSKGEIYLSFSFRGQIIPIGENLVQYTLSVEQAEQIFVQLGVSMRDGNMFCNIELDAPDSRAGYRRVMYRLDIAQTKAVHQRLAECLQQHYRDIRPPLQIVEQG